MKEYFLEELLQIKNGSDHKNLSDGNIPVYGSGGVMRYVNKAIYNDESILLPRKGTLSNIQYANEPFWTVDTLYYSVINKDKVVPYYLYYYLKRLDLSNLNSGTGVPSMTFGAYYGLKIRLPELNTQQKIAKVLSDLDAKIELNNKINAELEAMAKTLYDYWFVQFDFPVASTSSATETTSSATETTSSATETTSSATETTSSATETTSSATKTSSATGNKDTEPVEVPGLRQAQSPNQAQSPKKGYKSSGGKMVWNEELKREIPEGWEVKELGKYANIKKGTLITEKTANTNGNIKVISAGLDFSYFHDKYNYPENTITISASGASAGFINFWREPIFACDCTTVRGNSDADTIHILGFLKMRQEYIFQQARGSAQPHVYPKDIESLKIPVPPKEIIDEFGRFVISGNIKISNNLKENQELASLRDWLLPMLMNGQVTVGDVEEQLGMVAEEKESYKK